MSQQVWAVRSAQYVAQLGAAPFVGLPREELDGLHGLVEVLAIERERAERDRGYLPLVVYAAVHHNYAWRTHAGPPRSLGLCAELPMASQPDAPLFVDQAMQAQAIRAAQRAASLPVGHWRLAGLICSERLALVCIGRLTRRWADLPDQAGTRHAVCGHGELRFARGEFDGWSQLLIDNLAAL